MTFHKIARTLTTGLATLALMAGGVALLGSTGCSQRCQKCCSKSDDCCKKGAPSEAKPAPDAKTGK